MARESNPTAGGRPDRIPPYSEEAERGVLGSILLDSARVIDLCIQGQLAVESFHVPTHRVIYDAILAMARDGNVVVDVLTVVDKLKTAGRLDQIGGAVFLDGLIDSTPTAAHAEYYIDIVRQKHLLRLIGDCARRVESECYSTEDTADVILSRAEQAFLNITEHQHGEMVNWSDAVKTTVNHVETVLTTRRGLSGISTGFANLDATLLGLRPGEMTVLAARPGMGKTSLAMNMVENIALGRVPDKTPKPVGIFSLEMSVDTLVLRMLCSMSGVSSSDVTRGMVSHSMHGLLVQAASQLQKAPVYLDDTGGLEVSELRARARRMKRKFDVQLIVIDYLQLIRCRDRTREGRQQETAEISNNLKAMAKELRVPVIVISQLSRAPEQRDKLAKPKLSDLRDSGAIEQDADVVCLLRRPCKYPDDEEAHDTTLAIVDVAKHRNGPTNDNIRLNFEDSFTRFRDRAHGVDGIAPAAAAEDEGEGAAP